MPPTSRCVSSSKLAFSEYTCNLRHPSFLVQRTSTLPRLLPTYVASPKPAFPGLLPTYVDALESAFPSQVSTSIPRPPTDVRRCYNYGQLGQDKGTRSSGDFGPRSGSRRESRDDELLNDACQEQSPGQILLILACLSYLSEVEVCAEDVDASISLGR
jgi:hypothetical protein